MGVKGKGIATIIEDPFTTFAEAKKIYIKYLGTLDHPISKMIFDSVKKGNHVIIEITSSSLQHGILVIPMSKYFLFIIMFYKTNPRECKPNGPI